MFENLEKEISLVVGKEPLMVVYRNDTERFLVLTLDSYWENYVIIKISDSALMDMLTQKVTMEQTFRNAGKIMVTSYNIEGLEVKEYDSKTFDEKMLPKKGVYYGITSAYIRSYSEKLGG